MTTIKAPKTPLTIASALFEHREEVRKRRFSHLKKSAYKLLITQELIKKAMTTTNKRTPEDIDNLKRVIEYEKNLHMRVVRLQYEDDVLSIWKAQQQLPRLFKIRGEFHLQMWKDKQKPEPQLTQQMLHEMVQERQQIHWYLHVQQQQLRQHQKQMKQQRYQERWLQSEKQQKEIAKLKAKVTKSSSIKRRKYNKK